MKDPFVPHRHRTPRPFTLHVLYPPVQVFLETFGVVILPGVALREVVEPGAVFVDIVSAVDAAEPRASVDIAAAFDVLAPVSVVAVEADSAGRPRFPAFPNSDYHASSSSSAEVSGQEYVRSSTDVRANYGPCSILSNPGPHQNKNVARSHNKPNPGYSSVNDTNDLPRDATTSHSRKTCRRLYREQRTHRPYRAALSPQEAPQIRWVVAGKFRY